MAQKRVLQTISQIRLIELHAIKDSQERRQKLQEKTFSDQQAYMKAQKELEHLKETQIMHRKHIGQVNLRTSLSS
jgi:hypothetical protein